MANTVEVATKEFADKGLSGAAQAARFTFDYPLANPVFIRLVMTENIHNREFLARSKTIEQLNIPVIHAVKTVYDRGVKAGAFRRGLDAVELHMSISALCFFNVANCHNFALIFKRDMTEPEAMQGRRKNIVEMVARFVQK